MAATAPDARFITRRAWLRAASAAAPALLLPRALLAGRSEDVMAVITYVATALTAGNPDDALLPFDPALPGLSTLAGYFEALCTEVTLHTDVDLLEETGSDTESNVLLRWTLDLRERMSNEELERREREVRVHFVPAAAKAKYGRWKIAAFGDIELFNPSLQPRK